MADHSRDATVVEYAVQEMMKGKSPAAAARATAKKLNGASNIFIGGAQSNVSIDPAELEDALWDRLVGFTTVSIPRLKAGKEHYALGGTLQHFSQKPKLRAELKERVVRALGADPFPQDDGT